LDQVEMEHRWGNRLYR